MKILYQSFDGFLFDSEDKCLRHEKNNPQFIMYDANGITYDPEGATIIDIKSEAGVEKIIELFQEQDVPCAGIGTFGKGLYLWINEAEQYVYLTTYAIDIIKKYLCGD